MLFRGLLILILFWVIARAFWTLLEGVVRGVTGPAQQGGGRAGRTPMAVKMLPCPGCATYVVPGKAISMMSGGQTLYFCSEACRAEYRSQ